MRRILPKGITILGGISLGLSLTYLVGVGLAFHPAGQRWAEFFVPRALYLLLPPYGLLIFYLVARMHVGRLLLKGGALQAAIDYSRPRLKKSLLMGRREVANHRLVCARALVGLLRYDEALELLEGQHRRLPGVYAMEARRWLLELALRRDDRERATELLVDNPARERRARGELVAALACGAELALREGRKEAYRERMKDALWHHSSHSRVALCRALAMLEYEDPSEKSEEILGIFDVVEESVTTEIPARRSELTALRGLLKWRRGLTDEARDLIERAANEPCDQWSATVIEEVDGLIEDSSAERVDG